MLGKLEPSPSVGRNQLAKPLQQLSVEDAFAVQRIKVLDQRSMIQDAFEEVNTVQINKNSSGLLEI